MRLFVCLFICLLLVRILRQNRCFLNRYCRIQTLITKLLKKLWTWVFNMLNYITLWFEWYQIHNSNNLFVCFSLFAIVCLFICLFIYEVYLTSKRQNPWSTLSRYCCIQTLITNFQKELWTKYLDMFKYIKFWSEWYQNHTFNNFHLCLSVFGKVCLFICLFIWRF